MNWKDIWMMLFRTVELFGLNMGFWVFMAGGGVVVVVVFWCMKPQKKESDETKGT